MVFALQKRAVQDVCLELVGYSVLKFETFWHSQEATLNRTERKSAETVFDFDDRIH